MNNFSHGADIYNFASELGIKSKNVIDFSSNINQYSPKIKLNFNKIDISKYPDFRYLKLKRSIAKRYRVKVEQIALYNGASVAIERFLKRYDNICIYAPAYGEYKKYASKVTLINRFKNIYEEPPLKSLVIFVNPSTPDGYYYDIDELFKIWKKRDNTILIDESFLEFTKYPSLVKKIQTYPKLYILKSLTKFYASAGVRVGIIISNRENITTLTNKEPIWQISTYDQSYIIEALKDKKFIKSSLKKIKKDKKALFKVLKESNFIEYIYPSYANFFLVKLKNIDAFRVQERCKKEAILIRNCENFDFLDTFHVRFAVRKKGDIKRLSRILLDA